MAIKPNEFKRAMLCGLGRCVLACRKDPEKYRAAVIWGCTHQISYDAQCEGTHAWYLHELVSCYSDTAAFRDAAINALFTKNRWQWPQLQIEEFLHYLADDGDEIAKKALWDKYDEMYSALLAKKRKPYYRYFALRDDFEFLAIDLGCKVQNTLRIASDIGKLMRENPIYDAADFEQFFWEIRSNGQMTALRKFAKTDEDAAYFLKESDRAKKETGAEWHEYAQRLTKNRFAWQLSEEELRQHAENYVNETDPEKRAELINAFTQRPFPLDPEPIIKDALSENEHMRSEAWSALSLIRHPKVRSFAMENLNAERSMLIPVLVANYIDEDRPLIEGMLAELPQGEDKVEIIHALARSVKARHGFRSKLPPWLLYYLYDNNRCSLCREDVIKEMSQRRLLTDEMLQECLYDANEDIRKYAERRSEHRD